MPDRTDHSRDLLFGLLALQSQMVTLDELMGAIREGDGEDGSSIARGLLARRILDERRSRLVDGLVSVHLERHDNDASRSLSALGLDPATREKLGAALGDPPGSADRIAAPRADGDGAWAGPPRAGDETPTMVVRGRGAGSGASGRSDRYRILRLHAQGGLGAVYVARDLELNREVALKQILEHQADDPDSRCRFLLEAEITGGLEHPGIVPVYGFGAFDDGRPYYAMRFIHGGSLKEAIDRHHRGARRPDADPGAPAEAPPEVGSGDLGLRKLLRRFVDVCNAIDYAHARGVLHRDIKPSNVIVGRHGETLVVDWGLAKPLGTSAGPLGPGEGPIVPSPAGGSSETLPGSTMGTPAYMSPEQARGEQAALGPRADIYSLGATLYTILTGRPPFEGPPSRVIPEVVRGKFPAPRSVLASIDPALEAVCLKAMAYEPERRHASARDLAEDIERWMADEPVSAYREPWTRRLRRWMRSHRTSVAVAAALLASATVALAVGNYRVGLERDEANRARYLSENDFLVARNALNHFLIQMGDARLTFVPQLEPLRRESLRSATQLFEHMLARRADDQAFRRDLAAAYRKLANVERVAGRIHEAKAAHAAARRHLDKLMAMNPDDREAAIERALQQAEEGDLLRLTGRLRDAEPLLRDALASARIADGMLSDAAEAGSLTGLALMRTAALEASLGRGEESRAYYREAAERLRPLAERPAPGGTAMAQYLLALRGYAAQLHRSGKNAQALQEIASALLLSRQAMERHPGDLDLKYQHAQNEAERGRIAAGSDRAGAIASLGRSIETLGTLHQQFPNSSHYQESLADALISRGGLLGAGGRSDLDRALELAGTLAERSPQFPRYRRLLGNALLARGRLAQEEEAPAKAARDFERARAALDSASKDSPEDALTREALDELEAAQPRPGS